MSNIFYTWHLLTASVTIPTVSSLKEISIAMVTKFSMITLITMVTMMVMRRKMQMVLMMLELQPVGRKAPELRAT